MKLKTQEQIRKFELSAYIISIIVSTILTSSNEYEAIQQIQKVLENQNIDINIIRLILSNIYNLDFISSSITEKMTTEYKQLKVIYDEIIYNTSNFYKTIELSEPVSIFATYVYMYRKGYFSHDNKFLYSSNMKDFPKMHGLDVVRGKGVCRSISSFLTDIYNEMNMNSYNVFVKARLEEIRKMKKLSTISLETEENEILLSKLIAPILKYTPTSNHQITMVEYDNQNYIFDPTNDGFLKQSSLFKIAIPNAEDTYIRNHTFGLINTIHNALGIYPDGINMIKKYNQINKPTISTEEYEKRYLQALKLCIENDKLFQEFFHQNENLINHIYTISEQQSGMIKRLIPIIKK